MLLLEHPSRENTMNVGLVLGGGGTIGIAWETGFLEGCAEGGLDLTTAQVIVGTSAGAMVGARIAHRGLADAPSDRKRPGGIPADVFAHVAQESAKEIYATWLKMTGPDPASARRMGELSCQTENDGEAMVSALDTGYEWPQRDLRIVTVSTQSGERRVFDRSSGVELSRCIAASGAVPAMFAPIAIDGERYMDGQVHSGTNADLLLDDDLAAIVIAAPTCKLTADALGVVADHCLAAELKLLDAAGKRVITIAPRAEDKEAFGSSLMDPTHAESAKAAGHGQGLAAAAGELAMLK